MSGEHRILVAEDSEAGREQWQTLEAQLPEILAAQESPGLLSVTIAENAAELLEMHTRLRKQQRAPSVVLLDMNLPIRVALAPSADQTAGPTTKAAVWIAKRIRSRGDRSSAVVLWTNNVIANELNDAVAFCGVEESGRRVGDYVLDKAADLSTQAILLSRFLSTPPDEWPKWSPPEPRKKLGPALVETLPYLEAAMRPAKIAAELTMETSSIEARKERLRDLLCPELDTKSEYEMSTAIVNAARAARVSWIPLHYRDGSQDPLAELP